MGGSEGVTRGGVRGLVKGVARGGEMRGSARGLVRGLLRGGPVRGAVRGFMGQVAGSARESTISWPAPDQTRTSGRSEEGGILTMRPSRLQAACPARCLCSAPPWARIAPPWPSEQPGPRS